MQAQGLEMVSVCTCVAGPTLTEVIMVRWQLSQGPEALPGEAARRMPSEV